MQIGSIPRPSKDSNGLGEHAVEVNFCANIFKEEFDNIDLLNWHPLLTQDFNMLAHSYETSKGVSFDMNLIN